MATKEEDFVRDVFISHSHDCLLMFSNKGRMYIKKCYEIPEASRTAKGTNIVNLLSLDEKEEITTAIPIQEFTENEYLVMVTKHGVIKRVMLTEYNTRRTTGLYAITLDEGDELLYVMKTDGKCSILASTREGISITFDENDVRPMGRQARGVKAITLEKSDYVVGAMAIPGECENQTVLTITEKGYGKRTEWGEFKLQNRGGKGIICHRVNEKPGFWWAFPLCPRKTTLCL